MNTMADATSTGSSQAKSAGTAMVRGTLSLNIMKKSTPDSSAKMMAVTSAFMKRLLNDKIFPIKPTTKTTADITITGSSQVRSAGMNMRFPRNYQRPLNWRLGDA